MVKVNNLMILWNREIIVHNLLKEVLKEFKLQA
jgi:hypothetical protein